MNDSDTPSSAKIHTDEFVLERDDFLKILESMEDGVYIVNQEYDIEFANRAIVEEFGIYEGRKCYEYLHNSEKACHWCKNQEVFKGNTVRWEWYSEKNQKTYDLIDTPLIKSDGSISKLEIFRDITSMKNKEQERSILLHNYRERVKELNCLYGISKLVENPDLTTDELLQSIVDLIPPAWQYPNVTCSRIIVDNAEYQSSGFRKTEWRQESKVKIYGNDRGLVEVAYTVKMPDIFEGPFLSEERDLIDAISERVSRIVERAKNEEWDKKSDRFVLFLNKLELVHLDSVIKETNKHMEELIKNPVTAEHRMLAEIYVKEIQHLDRSIKSKIEDLLEG
jgi:hypothetical protein